MVRGLTEYQARARLEFARYADGDYERWVFRQSEPIPSELSDLAADAADALRSALDQAVYAVCVAKNPAAKHTHFPFGKDEPAFEHALTKGQSRDIPEEFRDLFRQMAPFRTGNDRLWWLNATRIINQHRYLSPTPPNVGRGYMHDVYLQSGELSMPPEWDDERQEFFLARIPIGTEFKFSGGVGKLHVGVCSLELDIMENVPAQEVFEWIAHYVGLVVAAIEDEAKKIGLLT